MIEEVYALDDRRVKVYHVADIVGISNDSMRILIEELSIKNYSARWVSQM